nr:FecR family protein [Pedobacter panaciterrae]
MDKIQFLNLIDRYLDNQANPQEILLVEEYFQRMEKKGESLASPDTDGRSLKSVLMKTISQPDKKRGYRLKWLIAAASIIIVATLGLLLEHNKSPFPQHIPNHKIACADKIKPGGNKAILTLSNGSSIDLDVTANGVILKQQGLEIKKDKDGHLIYTASAPEAKAIETEITYNTIETPVGGQYQLHLPDGTNVWLNASSSLKFPTQFTGKQRDVELVGEAYFEVAKDKERPFKVITGKQVIEVLGTHFNVNTYDDEEFTKTTLLEGSVKISKQNQSVLLKPGQQCVLKNNYFEIRSVNTNTVVDWKNGYFIFRQDNIRGIMRKLARWYNIDIEYAGKLEGLNFTGKVSRTKNLDEILRVLTLTGDVKFKVEGRRVTVMP